MRVLTLEESQAVGGGMTLAEGGAAVLALTVGAPIGFAMGFGLVVGGGLLWGATYYSVY